MKILALALILIMQLQSFAPLADTDACPVHGPGCAHGKECPAAMTQAVDEHSSCPSGGHGKSREKMKKYRCALTSCHGEALGGGIDAPFVVEACRKPVPACQAAAFDPEDVLEQGFFVFELLEPPEPTRLS